MAGTFKPIFNAASAAFKSKAVKRPIHNFKQLAQSFGAPKNPTASDSGPLNVAGTIFSHARRQVGRSGRRLAHGVRLYAERLPGRLKSGAQRLIEGIKTAPAKIGQHVKSELISKDPAISRAARGGVNLLAGYGAYRAGKGIYRRVKRGDPLGVREDQEGITLKAMIGRAHV